MKFMSKTRLNHVLLSITFNDKFWEISTWYSTFEFLTQQKGVVMKKNPISTTISYYF